MSEILTKRIPKRKRPASSAAREDWGVEGDAHAGDWHRQVSLLSSEIAERFPDSTAAERKARERESELQAS